MSNDDDDDGCNAHDDGYSIAYYRTLSLTYLVSLLTSVAAVNILAPIDFVRGENGMAARCSFLLLLYVII
jgi:hypothetical protein